MKYTGLCLLLLILLSCSFNDNSKYWNEHNDKRIVKQKKLLEIINKSNDITQMTLNEYKIYLEDYTKKSKYPDISQ